METVFLLHGMCRTPFSMMLFLGNRLKREGFRVYSFSYLTFARSIEGHADVFHRYMQQRIDDQPFHIVGHSLGSIIGRYVASNYDDIENLNSLVMLAPPNQAPRIAKIAKSLWPYRLLTGQAGQQITSDAFYESAFVNPPKCKVGVIAGKAKTPPLWFYEKSGDYVVAFDETKFEHMSEWQTVNSGHTYIMHRKQTIELVLRFIRGGSFTSQTLSGKPHHL